MHINGRQWWLWLREAAPLALGAALDTIYFRIDIVMLAALGTYSAVGIYSVGYKFSDLLGAVPLAVITPALTMMVTAWPGDVPEFRRTFRHALIILTVGSMGACVIFGVFAEPLVSTLYTERYADAADCGAPARGRARACTSSPCSRSRRSSPSAATSSTRSRCSSAWS